MVLLTATHWGIEAQKGACAQKNWVAKMYSRGETGLGTRVAEAMPTAYLESTDPPVPRHVRDAVFHPQTATFE